MLDKKPHYRRKLMSYKKLEIWQESRMIVLEIHKMTLEKLPKFEFYEEGSQIRRSVKSVKSNIVEGYGRRRYKQEFIKFLTYSLASCDETTDHLETLYETESLKDEILYKDLHERLQILGKKLNNFLQSVEKNHNIEK
jgi:four helix bundle protein